MTPVTVRAFRNRYQARAVGPFLTTLQQKRAEVLYHLGRLEGARGSPSSLAAPGSSSLDVAQLLTAINAEFNAAMHVLRTMLDVAAQIANAEKGLKIDQVYLHTVRDRLAGGARTAADSLIAHTEYLRDFDNRTKHERLVRTGAAESFKLPQGRHTTTFPVAEFEKNGRKHPRQPDGVDLVRDTYNAVVEGVCDLLDAL